MAKREYHQSKWRRFGSRHNAYLQLSKKGQFEIIGHLAGKHDIDDFCIELSQALKREWDIIQARRATMSDGQSELYFAASPIKSQREICLTQIPELKSEVA